MGLFAKAKLRTIVISLVAMICTLALLGMSVASYVTIRNISDYSAKTNMALGDGAAVSASGALTEQANEFLLVVARQQSKNCDSLLNAIKYNVELLEGVAADIFSHPEYYGPGRPVVRPSEVAGGVYASTYILPETVPMTDGVRRELDLLSNLESLLPTLTRDPDIIEFYVGMESGLFYNYTTFNYEKPEYDPRTRPWYARAAEQPGRVVFTEVYEDALGTGLVMTASKAVYDGAGILLGVAALDISLENMKTLILETRILESGYAFIINSEGRYIIHPGMGAEGFRPNIPEASLSAGSQTAEGYERMMNGETGFFMAEEDKFFIAFSPISVTGWSVGVTVNEDELLSALGTLSARMDSLTDEAEKDIKGMSGRAAATFIVIFIAVAVMVVLLSVILTFILSRPIQKLTEEVVRIGAGDLDTKIEGSYNDEFNKIRDAVNAMAADIKTSMNAQLQAEIKLNYDMLTGIYNRHYMEDALNKVIKTLQRSRGGKLTVMMIDIDYFKRYNDTYGHTEGDECLRAVAKTIDGSLAREDDVAARYGGEEFVVILPNTGEGGARLMAERILKNVQDRNIPHKKNDAAPCVTISIGVTWGDATAAQTGSDYIKRADKALYISKGNGRNRVTLLPLKEGAAPLGPNIRLER